jgi:hypothetical protein
MSDHRMIRWLRLCLGVAFLIGGGALLFWSIAKTAAASSTMTNGLPLATLIAVALGLAALGASADLFGFGQKIDAPAKVRNTKVYGAAEPASELEAKVAASGGIRAPLHERTFSD